MKQDFETAEQWTRKALDIYEHEFGRENLRTAMVHMNLGVCELYQRHDAAAEKTLLEAFEELKAFEASSPRQMRSAANWLRQLYERLGREESAAKFRAISTSKP
jgi:hypothetical protein